MAKAKSIGWAIYVAGFVIWLFGYLSTGHAVTFDWDVVAPSWISSFVPNLEAELGLALMFASVIPIYGRAVWGNLARLFACAALLGRVLINTQFRCHVPLLVPVLVPKKFSQQPMPDR
jgi:hypothetical protein